MKKNTVIFILVAFLCVIVIGLLPQRYIANLHHSIYKHTASCFPDFANNIIGKPAPKLISRHINEKALLSKLSLVHPWVEQAIRDSFSKYSKFSVHDVQDTFDFSMPSDNFTIFCVKDGTVTIQNKFPEMNGACKYAINFYREIFEYMAQKKYINNLTFVMRFSDKTDTNFDGKTIKDFAPVLAVTKDTTRPIDQDSILIPDWQNLEGWPPLRHAIDKKAPHYSWEKKINKVFWRGGPADVSGYRHAIVALSKKLNFEKIDAQFTYGPLATAPFLPPEEHIQYKFQLTMDGHTAAWQRPVWQLYSGCVMLKQSSNLIQWYYDAIKPGVHYIEVSNDPEDLLTVFDRFTDADLKRISDNAHNFAKENLSPEDMIAHIILVLQQYEKLQQQGASNPGS